MLANIVVALCVDLSAEVQKKYDVVVGEGDCSSEFSIPIDGYSQYHIQ